MKFVLVIAVFLGFSVYAESSDLNQIMKKMGHEYKLAIKSENREQMISHLERFILLIEQAKNAGFQADKKAQSIEGLNKSIAVAKSAIVMANKGQSERARKALKEINSLREEYHQLHEPPSVWELLFGK
ncbi:cytochrome b562 [Pseudoalteromonas obscura]|uniref:Cytochrome b562 n=1 Tax=Pseudoalteromonas obscura TaxID=3048491 RepID=A0ABT7EQN4_9GAMM|nr:cytochrome b562 [Pseudoalteromonas sp. P94(2023)]MDK2597349.1 cytochrome b562 [Pseudoalteromonas sp. P94(2023)]